MNTKAEQPRGTSAVDIGKLVLAVLVLAAGIFAYSWFDNTVPGSVRLAGVLIALVVALAIGAFTGPGRKARNFIAESQFEMRKVVWPTRRDPQDDPRDHCGRDRAFVAAGPDRPDPEVGRARLAAQTRFVRSSP
jgi:hypothetical protein